MTIESDVAAKAKEAMRTTGLPFKRLINEALRAGLDVVLTPPKSKPYSTRGRPMGLRRGLSYDNISELLSVSEGENHL